MRTFSQTDVGRRRDNNEDYVLVNETIKLYIVADGMGGHNAGEVASKIACESIKNAIQTKCHEGHFDFEKEIGAILNEANMAIKKYGDNRSEYSNMGTTVVVAYLDHEMLHVANVGDSRLYMVNDETLHQITKDHSLVAELLKIGSISEVEAANHPDKNIITSALGVDEKFDFYQTKIPYFEYKYILLCTDGLTNMLSKEEIFEIINNNESDVIPNKLIESANENGGLDNVTVVCIEL
ncbi:Stp1/IreP family PP2C-type Ser/Thr phosphatase [Fusibacter ferrireducens]|uniref:Stp1/IreP family PP2C-type Ser/Thr phosphatase n=1 Tax=Fusibacter ferrireducens TaxID=2785058 RepID=A0ABR9ZMP1_9FIRM|nr:Stp1/IreP family PP2C-type Ser/Thr phosphatase [Fusibacter ferrireducens]MBF4691674.1 Stp1/IreP family PP2C-type Ser/Thr phosphatase [Fusibacter ferrireducens]